MSAAHSEYELRRDTFLAQRGGAAQALHVRCACCLRLVLVYQKDGVGPLLRCYANRILGPPEQIARLSADGGSVESLPPLRCDGCGLSLGEPVRYRDGRLAWRMLPERSWAGPESSLPDTAPLVKAIAEARGLSTQLVGEELATAQAAVRPTTTHVSVQEHGYRRALEVERLGFGPLALRSGRATQFEFRVSDHWEHYAALVFGPVADNGTLQLADGPVLVRTDSGCASGQLFGDMTCDCDEQLTQAMQLIVEYGQGVVVHISHQDGRGFGTAFKLATLRLQERLGIDTVEAAQLLNRGSSVDRRTYGGVVAVLRALGIGTWHPLEVLSNNPAKAAVLRDNGYVVTTRGLAPSDRPNVRRHLEAKRDKLGHTIEFDALEP